jgi:uncharacterized protein (TIGR03382 family)
MNKLHTTLLAGSLLVGVAGASNAATFSYNFLETDSIPIAYSYTGSGTNYTFTGSTSETALIFAGNANLGSLSAGTPYSTTLSVSFTTSQGTAGFPTTGQELIDSVTATFTANNTANGATAGETLLQVTAGTGFADAGILSAAAGASTGGFAGSNTSGTSPNNVAFTSAGFSTADWIFQSYSFTVTLPATTSFSYTPISFPPPVSQLNAFTASLTGGGSATTPNTTPEPGAVALAMGALVSFGALRLRRRK